MPVPSLARSDCARPDVRVGDRHRLDGEPVEFSGDGMLAGACSTRPTTPGTVFGDRLPTKARKKLQKAHDKAADFPPGSGLRAERRRPPSTAYRIDDEEVVAGSDSRRQPPRPTSHPRGVVSV